MEGVQRESPDRTAPPSLDQLGRTTPLRIALLVLVVGELLVLTFMPYERLEARLMLLRQYNHVRLAWLTRSDPALGRPLDTSRLGLQVVPEAAGIIAISDCTGCSLRAVQDFARWLGARHISHLYVLSPRKPTRKSTELMRKQCKQVGVQAVLAWDRRGAARQQLNAFYAPRAYMISAAGRLAWLQRPGEPLPPEAPG